MQEKGLQPLFSDSFRRACFYPILAFKGSNRLELFKDIFISKKAVSGRSKSDVHSIYGLKNYLIPYLPVMPCVRRTSCIPDWFFTNLTVE